MGRHIPRSPENSAGRSLFLMPSCLAASRNPKVLLSCRYTGAGLACCTVWVGVAEGGARSGARRRVEGVALFVG
eukprot:1158762-Pelagomonas_calceolata.AAC.5